MRNRGGGVGGKGETQGKDTGKKKWETRTRIKEN